MPPRWDPASSSKWLDADLRTGHADEGRRHFLLLQVTEASRRTQRRSHEHRTEAVRGRESARARGTRRSDAGAGAGWETYGAIV